MFDTLTDHIGITGWSVLGGVVLAAYSTVGLLSVWCAWGRPYWFVRVVVLGVVLAPLLIVPANELVVIFFVQSVVTIVPLLVLKRRFVDEQRAQLDVASECMLKAPLGATLLQRSVLVETAQTEKEAAASPAGDAPSAPARRKFTWRDAALLAAVAAVIGVAAAVAARATWPNPEHFRELPLLGVCFGAFTLIAVTLVFAEVSVPVRLVLCFVLPPLPMIGWVMLTLGQVAKFPAVIDDIPVWSTLLVCIVFPWLPMAIWLAIARVVGFPAQIAVTRPIVKRLAQVVLAAVSLAILLPTLAASYDLVVLAPIPKEPLPERNGYDVLLRAGKKFDATIPRSQFAPYRVLGAFVEQHEDVFRETSAALQNECMVPVQYASFKAPAEGRQALQQLGRAILIKGKLAELEGRAGDAAQDYLDAIRLGNAVARGGMFINQTTGWKVQNNAIQELYGLRKWLTKNESDRLVQELVALDADANANVDDIDKSNARERRGATAAADGKDA